MQEKIFINVGNFLSSNFKGTKELNSRYEITVYWFDTSGFSFWCIKMLWWGQEDEGKINQRSIYLTYRPS